MIAKPTLRTCVVFTSMYKSIVGPFIAGLGGLEITIMIDQQKPGRSDMQIMKTASSLSPSSSISSLLQISHSELL